MGGLNSKKFFVNIDGDGVAVFSKQLIQIEKEKNARFGVGG